jgi:hypothetical protein
MLAYKPCQKPLITMFHSSTMKVKLHYGCRLLCCLHPPPFHCLDLFIFFSFVMLLVGRVRVMSPSSNQRKDLMFCTKL